MEVAASGDTSRAQRIIERGDKFKSWLTAQPPAIQGEVAAIGFIPWLIQSGKEEQ
jgi:hypothetical protein